jgi:uncharacterized protein (TIGR00661 family)
MNILYGVQATGNGHISRSREVIRYLKEMGHSVQVLLSGRDPAQLWDMEVFEPYAAFRGLTFITSRGKVRYFKTARQLNLVQFYRDIREFSAAGLDVVVTDFEPISARVARRNRIPAIGLGHQYAFSFDIPIAGANPVARFIMRRYAFADFPIGLHWHHFDQPILPPIIPLFDAAHRESVASKVLVYLPFEELEDILSVCQPISTFDFYIYRDIERPEDTGHIHLRPYSRQGFLDDLHTCETVISNAGFELASEALHLGKRIIAKPLAGQMEQLSNARVLAELGLAGVIRKLSPDAVSDELERVSPPEVSYPNVAQMAAEWIVRGDWDDTRDLCRMAWEQTKMDRVRSGAPVNPHS